MRTIKKNAILTALLLIAAVFIGTIAQAQPPRPEGPPPLPDDKQVAEMVTELSGALSLTEDQQAKISALFTAHFDEMRSEHEQSMKAAHEAMDKRRAEFEKEVKSVLTADQQKQFDDFRKTHDPRQGKPSGPPR